MLYHFNRYLLGLVSTHLCTYHRTEEFITALANYVVSQGVRITFDQIFSFQHFTIDDINYQLNSSIYVATECQCYVALTKTDIHLTAFDRLENREIQLIALTLITYSKARAPELRLNTRDSFRNDKAPF